MEAPDGKIENVALASYVFTIVCMIALDVSPCSPACKYSTVDIVVVACVLTGQVRVLIFDICVPFITNAVIVNPEYGDMS